MFLIISGFILFLFVANRSIYFGADVIGYINKFNEIKNLNFSYIFSVAFFESEKDPVFYYLAKITSFIGIDYRGWIAILSGIFITSFSIILYKYSKLPMISILLIISLGYLTFSMTGLRQGMAISFILLSYTFIRDRKIWKFILVVLFAALFHSSALVFLIAYPLAFLKFNSKHVFTFLLVLILYLFFSNQIISLLNILIWSDQYDYYLNNNEGLNYTGFLIQLIIFLFCLIFTKKVLNKNAKDITLYNLVYIGLLLELFSTEIAEIFRLSMYFSIFSVILVANSINTIENKYLQGLLSLIIIVVSCFYVVWSGVYDGFVFYWNY